MKPMSTSYSDPLRESPFGHPDAHDVPVPLGQVAGVARHLPDPLGGRLHLHGELDDGHATVALPLDQPFHHTSRSGAIRTSASAAGCSADASVRALLAPDPTSSSR